MLCNYHWLVMWNVFPFVTEKVSVECFILCLLCSLLASGSDDVQVIIWDPFRKKQLTTIRTGHNGNIFSVKVRLRVVNEIVWCRDNGVTVLRQQTFKNVPRPSGDRDVRGRDYNPAHLLAMCAIVVCKLRAATYLDNREKSGNLILVREKLGK